MAPRSGMIGCFHILKNRPGQEGRKEPDREIINLNGPKKGDLIAKNPDPVYN